jgi:hypothetical protein
MNTILNIMETKGVAGYDGRVKLITEDLFENVDPAMKSSFNMIFDMLDWFQAENVHRFRSGAAMKSEKYFLKYFRRQAEDFIQQLEEYEKAYESRILCRPLPPLSLEGIPEDLSPEIMSYLSPIVRLENLRRKYTNDFFMDGLSKKKIGQLKYIHERYEDTIYNIYMDVAPQSEEICGGIDVCNSIFHITNFVEEHKCKHNRVWAILKMYLMIEDHLMNTLIKSSVYDYYCNCVIKMLHLLVIVCQNPPQKKPKKRGCHEARIMTKVPHAI